MSCIFKILISSLLVIGLAGCGGGNDGQDSKLPLEVPQADVPRAPTPAPVSSAPRPPASSPAPVASVPRPPASTPRPPASSPAPVASAPRPPASMPRPPASSPDVVQMDVINGIRVPKDPGPVNNATVSGIDSDKNGSRDDIDRFVALTFGNDAQKFKEAMFLSKMHFNAYLKPEPKTQQEAQEQIQESFYNYHCYNKEFGSEIVSTSRIPDLIESLYLNTPLRYSYYRKQVSLAGVMSIQFHANPSKLCTGGIK